MVNFHQWQSEEMPVIQNLNGKTGEDWKNVIQLLAL